MSSRQEGEEEEEKGGGEEEGREVGGHPRPAETLKCQLVIM